MSTETNAVLLNITDGVAVITLNQPKSMNALSPELQEELFQIIAQVGKDRSVGAVVLTGNGRAFCAGGDLNLLTSGISVAEMRSTLKTFQDNAIIPLVEMEKPVIAAVNGAAMGAGFNVALCCDLIYAANTAVFGQVFVNLGLTPDNGGFYFLPRLIGLPRAKELMFTGRSVNAQEALEMGLVNKVFEAEKLLDETIAFAKKFAAGPRIAIGMTKKILNDSITLTLNESLDLEAMAQAVAYSTEDYQEGVQAFFEKRKPVFKGK